MLWLDVWVDADAPVRRVKIEPQLKMDQEWATPYPMEVRVVEATVPEGSAAKSPLCGQWSTDTDMARRRFRNAQQDAALAERVAKENLTRLTAGCEANPGGDPEWYLPIRDYLFRVR